VRSKISVRKRSEFARKLIFLLRFGLALVLTTLVAKSLAVWLGDYTCYLAIIVNDFSAWTVGGMVAVLLIKVGDIRDIFGYLFVGVDMALRFRTHNQISPNQN
jgi:hypothetical protein